jgi:hypothetical protein
MHLLSSAQDCTFRNSHRLGEAFSLTAKRLEYPLYIVAYTIYYSYSSHMVSEFSNFLSLSNDAIDHSSFVGEPQIIN